MQFIDKAMNRALKWENVDVTIPEMIDLIQTEILEKVNDKDLVELKKGMQKTFVLAVGRGSSLRFYPSSRTPVRLCLNFNILTHQLQRISLRDTVNKKEYFIPTGKASCTKLQSGVLRRMAQCSHGGKIPEQKPRYSERQPNRIPERKTESTYRKYGGEKVEADTRFGNMGRNELPQNDKWNDFEASWTGASLEKSFYSSEHRNANAKGGRFQRKRQSRFLPIMVILFAALFMIGLAFGGYQLCNNLTENSETDYISVVQNGYLGNNTDITVMELFDGHYCSVGYEKGIWSGGISDNGYQTVNLKYPAVDEMREEILIQFRVLEDGCFRANDLNHFLLESEKASDTYCILNYICYVQHLQNNSEIVGDALMEYGYIAVLNSTPCYMVRYGTSADYSGDRSSLYQKFGDSALEISSAMLLNKYGLLDLSYYYPDGTEDTTPTEASTQPETTPIETIPETTTQTEPVPSTEPPEKQTARIGYVLESSGGLNIRNGPGRDYAEIGRLAPNEQVTVYETLAVGTANWGRIGEGQWVCIDYVVFPVGGGDSAAFGTDIPEQYLPIIQNLGLAIQYRYTEQQLDAIGLNPELYSFIEDSTLGYVTIDLDWDGTKELLIGVIGDVGAYGGSNGTIFDLYTISNGGPVRVLSGRARDSYHLCANGMIANEGSSGASYSGHYYYRFNISAMDNLEMVEAVIYNGMYEYDYLPSGSGPWYYTTEDTRIYGDNYLVPISEEDVKSIWNYYSYADIPYMVIPEA